MLRTNARSRVALNVLAGLLLAPTVMACGVAERGEAVARDSANGERLAVEQTAGPCDALVLEGSDFTRVLDDAAVTGEQLATWYQARTEVVVPSQVERARAVESVTVCRVTAPNAAPPGPPRPEDTGEGEMTAIIILGLEKDPELDVMGSESFTRELFALLGR